MFSSAMFSSAVVFSSLAAAPPHGRCGFQCAADADCAGCGLAGACSCPDVGTPYLAISCTCVDRPNTSEAPTTPAVDVQDSVWPSQWSANVTSWVYRDFTNASVVASGRFYYDAVGGHSRSDWTPYINGKDATQVWIADLTTGKSNYYVKSGPL
eukprot:6349210-Prymnesium_polylepis.1